ncbi:hypothetical protein A33K_13514 [Burkholderia humptydooensis MSMB43]|uniref:Uncharacterized protein n=1 Tax=Burkholderia humptydooensis MSMB43 TaxID=441157 RepID=A0ABN0GD28_9BURK|nr:hypothetical protein A33K_13514 [Burkholderia humptydooensis MSMB43]
MCLFNVVDTRFSVFISDRDGVMRNFCHFMAEVPGQVFVFLLNLF